MRPVPGKLELGTLRRRAAWRVRLGVLGAAAAWAAAAGHAQAPRLKEAPTPAHIQGVLGEEAPQTILQWAAAPTLGTLTVFTPAHGMVPLQVSAHVDLDNTTTGDSSLLGECLIEWELRKADGSALQGSEIQTVTDPIDGSSVNLATGTRGYKFVYVLTQAGSYKLRVRLTNRAGEASSWSESSTITAAADTRTSYYVSGSGSDSNDGLSAGAPKLTFNAVWALAGNNAKIIIADDTTVAMTADINSAGTGSGKTGVWITRSGTGSAKPILDKASFEFRTGGLGGANASGQVWSGIRFVNGNGLHWYGEATTGAVAIDCETGTGIGYSVLVGGTAAGTGNANHDVHLLILRMRNLSTTGKNCLFAGGAGHVCAVGCDFSVGVGGNEQTLRMTYSDNSSRYNLVAWCDLNNENDSGVKGPLRLYSRQYVTVLRTRTRSGGVAVGDDARDGADPAAVGWRDYLFDGCVMEFSSARAGILAYLHVHDSVRRLVVRDCILDQNYNTSDPVIRLNNTAQVNPFEDLVFINSTVWKRQGSGGKLTEHDTHASNNPTDVTGVRFRNCLFKTSANTDSVIRFQKTGIYSGNPVAECSGCIFPDYGAGGNYLTVASTTYDWSGFTGLVGVTAVAREDQAINGSTYQPDGTAVQTQGALAAGSWRSINGVDRAGLASNQYAGAWNAVPGGGGGPEPAVPKIIRIGPLFLKEVA